MGDNGSYRDHLEAIFDGLLEFSSLMTFVYNRTPQCTISEVESMIISQEARLDRAKKRQLGDVFCFGVSIFGSCLFLGPNLISWSSHRQTVVARARSRIQI